MYHYNVSSLTNVTFSCHCAHRDGIWERGGTTAHITNPVLLHTVVSDRQEVQLHTLLTLYCCTLCCQTGGTTAHITNPVLLHTVPSDRQEVQLHTILTLYCCTLCRQTDRRYNCTHY